MRMPQGLTTIEDAERLAKWDRSFRNRYRAARAKEGEQSVDNFSLMIIPAHCWPQRRTVFITLPLVFLQPGNESAIAHVPMQIYDERTTVMHWQRTSRSRASPPPDRVKPERHGFSR